MVSIYRQGKFVDLCRGPHVSYTSEIKAFKLMSIAGAYWRGDEHRPMLQRIYGVAFARQAELDEYLKSPGRNQKKRPPQNRQRPRPLRLFGLGRQRAAPLHGKRFDNPENLERFVVDEEIKRGYKHVYTPDLANVELYKTSGHYPYYKDTMYPVMKVDEEELMLRPMTCPSPFPILCQQAEVLQRAAFQNRRTGQAVPLRKIRRTDRA